MNEGDQRCGDGTGVSVIAGKTPGMGAVTWGVGGAFWNELAWGGGRGEMPGLGVGGVVGMCGVGGCGSGVGGGCGTTGVMDICKYGSGGRGGAGTGGGP